MAKSLIISSYWVRVNNMIGLIIYILFIAFTYKVILDHYTITDEYGNEEAPLEIVLLWIAVWIVFAGIYCVVFNV